MGTDKKTSHAVVDRNIQSLLRARTEIETPRTREQRIVQAVWKYVRDMQFVYINFAFYGVWIALNSGFFTLPRFDPYPYTGLTLIAALEAIVLSTFVLIGQSQSEKMLRKRDDLDVQLSLLTEYELTELIRVTSAIAERLGISSQGLNEFADHIPAEDILEKIEHHERKHQAENGGPV